LPISLDQREAGFLHLNEGENVFKLEHIYYDFADLPSAFGWFLIAPEKMPLVCRMGVWHD
jgi:GntR family transcriptional regulator